MSSRHFSPFLSLHSLLASALFFCLSPIGQTEESASLLFSDDFSDGAAPWKPTDPSAWKITKLPDGNQVYENLGGSKYAPPHRSPKNISLLDEIVVGDFVLTAKVVTKQTSRAHRDMCLFFGYQDPSKFYYVHLGEKKDDHANQIFIVNDAPRIKISEEASDGTPWKDETWHTVRVVRNVASGLIEVYFDDMKKPTHVAHDKHFTWGQIGIGTFDDKGLWDDVELRGVRIVPQTGSTEGDDDKQADAESADSKSLEFTKWTPDFQVPDPVSISLDENGVAYVTQTQRRKSQDLDIRNNRDWIPNDVGLASVEEKLAFYHERLAPDRSDSNQKRVDDHNGDGSHDYRDLMVLSERIYRIADTDGDGLADAMDTYAENFQTEVTGIAAGVLVHDGDVYSTIAPDVWKLRDTDGDGKADRREVFAHGFGVHIAYAGHDMHGLTVGVDGRIYWTIGDKGVRVKSADGRDWRFPNHGALLRAEPDGSHFEVYARGLRNIQEIAFDAHGNIFGVDNDADKPGEMERFVYIANHIDAGWRANWQYREPDYNPWTAEKLWQPWHDSQPAYLTPPITNYMNGPAGFVWNPGTALGPDYDGYFFLNSAPNGQQWAFQAEEKGASFEMVNDHQIGNGIPLVGLTVGPDGALYSVDWGGGYPLNQKGAVWKIDVPGEAKSDRRQDTAKLLKADSAKADLTTLTERLSHADQRVRLKAQFELVKREKLDTLASLAADDSQPRLARLHAIWGIGQLTRYRDDADLAPLIALLEDADSEVRAQATKTIGDGFTVSVALSPAEFPNQQGQAENRTLLTQALLPLLEDANDRVRFFAAIALGNLGIAESAPALIAFLETVAPDEVYLRHAGIIGLTGCAPTEALTALADHDATLVRAAAVVALRRREDSAVAVFLEDKSAWVASEAARAIHDDWMIPDAMPALAASLTTTKHADNAPFIERALNANFRLGRLPEAERIVAFAANDEVDEAFRFEAFDSLLQWTEPPVLDRVVGRNRPLESRDSKAVAKALSSHIDRLLTDKNQDIQRRAMALAQLFEVDIPTKVLVTVFENEGSPANLRSQALRSLTGKSVKGFDAMVASALTKESDNLLKIAALDILVVKDYGRAREAIATQLESPDAAIPVKQHAVKLLGRVDGTDELLATWLKQWDQAPAGLQLDLLEVAASSPFANSAAVSKIRTEVEKRLAADPFSVCLEGGDPMAGENIVRNNVTAQCIACHKLEDGKGSTVGPNLKAAGLKEGGRAYLLESLVNPQAVITSGYGIITLTMKDGSTIAGQFRREKDGVIELRDPEGKVTKVKASEVKDRSPVLSTMPPLGVILSKREVRDVVAYLSTLQAKDEKKKK